MTDKLRGNLNYTYTMSDSTYGNYASRERNTVGTM